jgi:hypothetical protein
LRYKSPAEQERANWRTLPESLAHVVRVDKCSPEDARSQISKALENGDLRLRWGTRAANAALFREDAGDALAAAYGAKTARNDALSEFQKCRRNKLRSTLNTDLVTPGDIQ